MDEMTKRLIKEAAKGGGKGAFFHSSGYAQAQVGEHMGAASTQSFKQRQEMKREFVGKYDDTRLAREALNRQAAGGAKTCGEDVDAGAAGGAKKFDPKG